jgi:hypothetical protein
MASKRVYGVRPFMRGEIYKLLENPIYIGEIHHKGHHYKAQHPPIVDRKLWNAVRAKLAANAHDRHVGRGTAEPSLLAGLLHDDQGNRLTPTHTVKNGKRYRYYALQHPRARKAEHRRSNTQPSRSTWRIPAAEIETAVITQLTKRLADPHWLLKHAAGRQTIDHHKAVCVRGKDIAARLRSRTGADLRAVLLDMVRRVILADSGIRIQIDRSHLIKATGDRAPQGRKHLGPGKQNHDHVHLSAGPRQAKAAGTIQIHVPISLVRRGLETKLIIDAPGDDRGSRKPDPVLVKLVANAHRWWDDLVTGRYLTTRALAQAYGTDERYVARVLRLAFLAPPIIVAIVTGQQRIELNAQRLMTVGDLPHSWGRQIADPGIVGF